MYINFDDFNRLINFRRNPNEGCCEISSLVEDFIKTIFIGKIDLAKFELDYGHYREINSQPFFGSI